MAVPQGGATRKARSDFFLERIELIWIERCAIQALHQQSRIMLGRESPILALRRIGPGVCALALPNWILFPNPSSVWWPCVRARRCEGEVAGRLSFRVRLHGSLLDNDIIKERHRGSPDELELQEKDGASVNESRGIRRSVFPPHISYASSCPL
jgi:hypothetical protein